MSAGSYDVVWPRSPRGIQTHRLAPRLERLDGKRIAFLWDYLFRGDELFPVRKEELAGRGVEVIDYEAFGNTHGSDEREMIAALPAKLLSLDVDAVVSGMGC